MKKIIVVGATGKLGKVVAAGLDKDYEVVRAGRNGPDLEIDAFDFAEAMIAIASVGQIDGIVSCIGGTPFKPFEEMTMDDFITVLIELSWSRKVSTFDLKQTFARS